MTATALVASWFFLIALTAFFSSNVMELDGGAGGYQYLYTSLFFVCVLAAIHGVRASRIMIKRSFLLLTSFYLYFLIRLVADTGDYSVFKELTVGTTGGTLISYILGAASLTAVGCVGRSSVRRDRFIEYAWFYVYMAIAIAFTAIALSSNIEGVQSDLFMIKDSSGGYQRPGNLLSMKHLIESFLVVSFFLRRINIRSAGYLGSGLIVLCFSLDSVLSIVLSQLIGSNSGMLMVGIAFVVTMSFLFFLFLDRKKKRLLHPYRTGKVASVYDWVPGVIKSFLAIVVAVALASYVIVVVTDFDLTVFRAFSFLETGESAPSSVSSRFDLIRRFYMEQLAYSPIMGNMAVDRLTTGTGTYAHSLPLSLASHVGFVGAILFAAYLLSVTRESRNIRWASYGRCPETYYRRRALSIFAS